MLQIVKQPENGGAGYVLVAVMDGDPGKWMTLVFDKSFNTLIPQHYSLTLFISA